uniref:RNA-dependent RNA polymerase n=1 Tax=Rhizoctonia solani partitivirus 8 TaxID=2600094 RepID=A0A5B8H9E4_9VIRU|nr:RNA-dependent RNA polymerase [Rhizoctonia solani partitivirus 8]
MCLQKNIKIIGKYPNLATNIHRITDPQLKFEYQSRVTQAMKAHFNPSEVKKIHEGFRRSQWSEEAFKTDIDKLDSDYFEVTKDEHYHKAIDTIKRQFFTPEKKLRPVHYADLRHYPWELSTNVGAPYNTAPKWKEYVHRKYQNVTEGRPFDEQFERDLFAEAHKGQSLLPEMLKANMSKRNLYNETFFMDREKIHRIKDGYKTTKTGHDYKYWHSAFARLHLVEEEDPDKVRLVFGAPWLSIKAEAMFIWPIQAWLMSQGENSPLLWGYETLTGGWYRLRNYFHRKFRHHTSILTADWSGFDRRARHTVISDIHSEILRPMFTFEEGYHPTQDYPTSKSESYDPQRLENLWNWMTEAVLKTPLLMHNGDMLEFQHSGIYSGYLQTQLLDSIYNMVMIYSTLFRLGFKESEIALKVQGDDSVIALKAHYVLTEHWLIPEFERLALKHFGAVLSTKKTEYHSSWEHVEVLKYRNENGLPYRDGLTLMAQLYHPEGSLTLSALKARAIGIAYAAVGRDLRVFRTCEDIFNSLPDVEVGSSLKHQPDQIQFLVKYLRFDIELDRFPLIYETVNRLMDERHSLPSTRYWPTSHFIGLPGQ